jgi:hypothetical protein
VSWNLGAGDIRRSWAGTGSLEINGPDDHFELRDYVIVLVYVVAVDVIGFFAGTPLQSAAHRMCGPLPIGACFDDPQNTIHDAWLHVWLTLVVGVLTIAAVAAWKTGRAVVATMQAVVFAVVVIISVTAVIHAQGQLQELRLCHTGAAGTCVGVHRVN